MVLSARYETDSDLDSVVVILSLQEPVSTSERNSKAETASVGPKSDRSSLVTT